MHTVGAFQKIVWDFYSNNKRPFAWRNVVDPYCIVVSEVMLQQTQTHRVASKYEEFIVAFPTFGHLARASLHDVLNIWQGLGYYRRAKYMYQMAKIVVNEHDGILPDQESILQTFPGIGPATAASICAFAFNKPTIFIETNIRTVFIDYFFKDKTVVTDKEIMPLIKASVDNDNAREWYYALMDYGVWLKALYGNQNRKSAHYTRQSKFEGSDRQIRAKILKLIIKKEVITDEYILFGLTREKERVEKIINQLKDERFIVKSADGIYTIV